ncbi:MAG: YceI family protein [Gemmatimonadetes bacterium]|nr:YceI family protein [Gemmatimonadota bacterium]
MSTWNIDPTHSTVGFSVKHLMISTVRGRFSDYSATLNLDEAAPANSSLEVTINAASVDTRTEQRDNHLRSADFFDVANHPSLTFKSTKVDGKLDGDFTVTGDLTIRGTTRPITLKASFEGAGQDPWGNERKAFSASGKINREEFGLTWNQALEAGGLLVSTDVKFELEVQFVRAAQARQAA